MLPHSDPWDKDYYLTVVCLVPSWLNNPIKIWFDHSTHLPTPLGLETIQKLVDECDIFAAQNLKYDLNILRWLGIDFGDTKLHCTMVTDYLLNGQNTTELDFNLNAICERRGLPLKLDKVKEYWNKGINTYDIPEDLLDEYVEDDTIKVSDITQQQLKELDSTQRIYDIQMEFIYSLSDMELNGIRWNLDKSSEILKEFRILYNKYEERIREIANEPKLNIGSPSQLSGFLYGGNTKIVWEEWTILTYKNKPESKYYLKKYEKETNFPGIFLKSGEKTSIGKDIIVQLKTKTPIQEEVKAILIELSTIKKLLSSIEGSSDDKGLINKIQIDGNIHPSLNQAITVTGRLSSSNPNGQNLPRGSTSPIKQCIVPIIIIKNQFYDGVGEADLSQIEWRAAAQLSWDEVMINEINSGVDQHASACVNLMELPFIDKKDKQSSINRNHAKVFNFRMIYRGSWWGFYLDPNMPNFSKKRWQDIVNGFFEKYYGLNEWHHNIIKSVYDNQGWLEIPTGRKFKFHLKKLKGGETGYKESEICNYPVQGISGGDILPLWACVIRRGMKKYKMKSIMNLTVHDSLIFNYVNSEVDRLARLCVLSARMLPKYISNYFKMDWVTNLDAEFKIGPSYGNLKDYEVKI